MSDSAMLRRSMNLQLNTGNGNESLSQDTNTILDNAAIRTDSKRTMSDSVVLYHSMDSQLTNRNGDVVEDTIFMKIDACDGNLDVNENLQDTYYIERKLI